MAGPSTSIQTMMVQSDQTKKELVSYKRDVNGHLMCHKCDFKPKATPAHPFGNPSTLHYHLKKQHDGNCSHVCKTCGYAFLHKLALDTHIASRHPETLERVETFRCNVPGCEFESLTLGNLEIHKARKHCSNLVNQYLETIHIENKKVYHCQCCNKDFKSSTSFNYHIVKCLDQHNIDTMIPTA